MRRLFLPMILIAILSSTIIAYELPWRGYIGLFVDDKHDEWCSNVNPFEYFEIWVWCLPSERGMRGAEFRINYCFNIRRRGVTIYNDDLFELRLGDNPGGGVAVLFKDCMYDWIWIAHETLYLIDDNTCDIHVSSHPDLEIIQFRNCQDGFPPEPCIEFTPAYVGGYCGPIAVQSKSWGAIKSIYRNSH